MNTNRLALERSPYLLQHAYNPVDWFPWGEEAFSVAQTTGRPVFLSVGYSTCHWCHVMAHEAFENVEIARLLNEFFINIKVDREERPDVDRIYMAFVQATTGSGGWPMSVWLTPHGKPFFGGTYFPPEDRYGRPGFPRVLKAIHDLWKRDPARVHEQGNRLFSALIEETLPSASSEFSPTTVSQALEEFACTFDKEYGGFGGAPKFPRAAVFEFLLSCSLKDQNAHDMTLFSLRKIALGGIYDHLGGGFHRYSVDECWHVPHFEKMLYDQAQLVMVLAQAFQLSHDKLLAEAALHTVEYMMRDLSHEDGGFYSAEDADSEIPNGSGRRAEGAFYLWKSSEILEVLGLDLGALFCQAYGIYENGNIPESGDPHGEFVGLNILARRLAPQAFSQKIGLPLEEVEKELLQARLKLFSERNKRARPSLDDKVLTAWNGLAISALARAGVIFQKEEFVRRAEKAAKFLQMQMWKNGKLVRSWREGVSSIPGFAVDYAFLIQGLLDLYEADFNQEWLRWALELQTVLDHHFWDDKGGSYFESAAQDPRLPQSMRENYDGAEPTANSVGTLNLLRLSRMFRNSTFEDRAKLILSAFSQPLVPTALPFLLKAALFHSGPREDIVIAGCPQSGQTRALVGAIRRQFRPTSILLLADGEKGSELLSRNHSLLKQMQPICGQPAAYFCKGERCQAPIVDPDEI